jgi:hypothetical protein
MDLESRVVRIEIVDDLKEGCTGVYHCGENKIEVLMLPQCKYDEKKETRSRTSDLKSISIVSLFMS